MNPSASAFCSFRRSLLWLFPVVVAARVAIDEPICAQETVSSDSESPSEPLGRQQSVLVQLASPEFSVRLEARKQLRELSARQLQSMAQDPNLPPEAGVVLLKEVERRYSTDSADSAESDRRVMSQLLETLRGEHRLVLADAANRILDDHWRVRVALARVELEKLGAYVRSGSFTSRNELRWMPGSGMPSLQILLGEDYTGGLAGLDLIERMSRLTDPGLGIAGISVWLLEGHPLDDLQYARLSELVGQDRIQERSRVALGIRSRPGVDDGVIVESVTRGSSAADAGLNSMDKILAILEPVPDGATPEERQKIEQKSRLRDFDDLVERLKQYRDGDVIRLKVVRGAGYLTRRNVLGPIPDLPGQLQLKEETVDVTLKGWEKLPVGSE